jgi:hypothetical protein
MFALLLGLGAFVLVFSVTRLIPRLMPRQSDAEPGSTSPTPLLVRAAMTVAALAVWYYARTVLLPVIDQAEFLGAFAPSDSEYAMLSILGLGIAPIVSAFVLVELAALIVPAWRRLRGEGPDGGAAGRARLFPFVVGLSVVLSLVQGWFISVWLASLNSMGQGFLASDMSISAMAVTTLTMTAGVMLSWILAAWISARGLCNGLAALILAEILIALVNIHELRALGPGTAAEIASWLAAVLVTILATTLVLRARVGGDRGFRLPTSGIVPLSQTVALAAFFGSLALVSDALPLEWLAWFAPADQPSAHFIAVLLAMTVLFSWLFSRPAGRSDKAPLLAPTDDSAGAETRAFWLATGLSAAYLGGLVLVHWWLRGRAATYSFEPLSIAAATAIAMDLVAEWRARARMPDAVAIRPLQQVQLVDPILGLLEDAGITAFARARHYRALLFFFGPYMPIEIHVSAADADQARTLLDEHLSPAAD